MRLGTWSSLKSYEGYRMNREEAAKIQSDGGSCMWLLTIVLKRTILIVMIINVAWFELLASPPWVNCTETRISLLRTWIQNKIKVLDINDISLTVLKASHGKSKNAIYSLYSYHETQGMRKSYIYILRKRMQGVRKSHLIERQSYCDSSTH